MGKALVWLARRSPVPCFALVRGKEDASMAKTVSVILEIASHIGEGSGELLGSPV